MDPSTYLYSRDLTKILAGALHTLGAALLWGKYYYHF